MVDIQQIPCNMSQDKILTVQPISYEGTHSENETCVIDQKTVLYFRNLIRKYKKYIGEMDDDLKVCSGGLQQYLNRQMEKRKEREENFQAQSKFESLPVSSFL